MKPRADAVPQRSASIISAVRKAGFLAMESQTTPQYTRTDELITETQAISHAQ
jgi:hypothetical protein